MRFSACQSVVWLGVFLVSTATSGHADEVEISGKRMMDVLVEEDSRYYYVCDPETGSMEKVSKQRKGFRIIYESREEEKKELRKRFEEAQQSTAGPVKTGPAPSAEMSGKRVEAIRKALVSTLFTLQLELWHDYGESERIRIETSVRERALSKAAGMQGYSSALADQNAALGANRAQLGARGAAVSATEASINSDIASHALREGARDKAEGDAYADSAAFWNAMGEIDRAYGYESSSERSMRNYRQGQANAAYSRAGARYGAALDTMDSVSARANAERAAIGGAISGIEATMERNAREAAGATSRANQELARAQGYLDRVALLNAAVLHGVEPSEMNVVLSKEFYRDHETEAVEVGDDGLVVTLRSRDGAPRDACLSVYEGDDATPFTRDCTPDDLGVLAVIVDKPGQYRFAATVEGGGMHLLRVIRIGGI